MTKKVGLRAPGKSRSVVTKKGKGKEGLNQRAGGVPAGATTPPGKFASETCPPKKSKTSGCRRCKDLENAVARLTGSKHGVAPKQRYFDENWLAVRWGMTVKYVQNLRYRGGGPTFEKFGSGDRAPVRYRLRDILAFERERKEESRPSWDSTSKF
jgi:hypothetical protein